MKRIAAVAAVAAAAAVSATLGMNAEADTQSPKPPAAPGEAETVDIGEVEEVEIGGAELAEHEQILTYPGASYVKLHFSRMRLAEGDFVTVSNIDGTELRRYERSNTPVWSTSVSGSEAVVKLHLDGSRDDEISRRGVQVDKVAWGLSEDEVVEREQARPKPESVCGEDERRDGVCFEDSDPRLYANTGPVARLLIDGVTLCTAWRVGPRNRMLTNNHCFDDDRSARNTEVWFDYECVSCGSRETTRPVKVHGAEVLAADEDYDYTLFTVDDFEAVREFGHLTLSRTPAEAGDRIYVPQHPYGEPSQIAATSGGDDCTVDQASFDGYVPDSDLSYYCDTAFGSSGAPVISRDTHEVVALHHFGGCPNSGVRSDKLLRHIGRLI